MASLRPTGITANRQAHELSIQWNDGHESQYAFTLLRYACPCAECRGGHDKMGSEPDLAVFTIPNENTPKTRLSSLEAVGTYALTIEWEDGHHYGIYTWQYLRALCTCPVCHPGGK
jgi:DUF971 family protein